MHTQSDGDLKIPEHIAIIPDGNRRWARERKLPTFAGHKKGFEITPKIARAAREMGVHTLTIWAFSTENWNRSAEEISYLMKMYEWFVKKHLAEASKDNVRIYHLGRKDRIPGSLAELIADAEKKTCQNTEYVLNIALDYGGHDEILRAIHRAQHATQTGELATLEGLDEEIGAYRGKYPYYRFKDYLDTGLQPHPYVDLVIRTSGEQRTSGLLSWQLAYAEYYWEKDHFPDFTPKKLRAAIEDFSGRDRRFGGDAKTSTTGTLQT